MFTLIIGNLQFVKIPIGVQLVELKMILVIIQVVLKPQKELVVLIKPQFECGKEIAKKYRGVIKDEKIQENIRKNIINYFENNSFNLINYCTSPILGTAGNKEFLAYFIKK